MYIIHDNDNILYIWVIQNDLIFVVVQIMVKRDITDIVSNLS